MRNIAVAVALILMLATAAQAGEIFRYVTNDGTISFTDDVKRISLAYKDVAETVVLGEFKDFDSLTISTVKYDLAPLRASAENPNRVDECTGHASVTSERRQFGDFNRTIYLVHDECGELVSATFYQPEVRINR
jgi:thiamine pyrophosphokinase